MDWTGWENSSFTMQQLSENIHKVAVQEQKAQLPAASFPDTGMHKVIVKLILLQHQTTNQKHFWSLNL